MLVTIMLANNKVSSVNDIRALVEVVRRVNPNAIFHTDASQRSGKSPSMLNLSSLLDHDCPQNVWPERVGATYA